MRHAARDHAKYSGSSAARTLACAAWVRLSAALPPRGETDAAEEGTEAHELLDACLSAGVERAPHVANAEHAAAVNTVLDYVTNLYLLHGRSLTMQHEERFALPQSVVPQDDACTYPDIVLINREARHAWSIDFKYGAGLMIEAENNAQLLYGAAAAFWHEPIERITCTIIQPRGWHPRGPVREWIIGGAEIVEFQAQFEAAIARAEAGGEPTPGPHCRFCPAAIVCPAYEARAVAVLQPGAVTHDAVPHTLPNPATIPMDRIGRIVSMAGAVRDWLKDVEAYAYEQARGGAFVPGHKLVEASDRRKWKGAPTDLAARVHQMSGGKLSIEKDIMPPSLAPLTKMEDELVRIARSAALPGAADQAAKQMRDQFAFLTERSSSGTLSLVPDTDPRPAADRASQAFKGVAIPLLPASE